MNFTNLQTIENLTVGQATRFLAKGKFAVVENDKPVSSYQETAQEAIEAYKRAITRQKIENAAYLTYLRAIEIIKETKDLSDNDVMVGNVNIYIITNYLGGYNGLVSHTKAVGLVVRFGFTDRQADQIVRNSGVYGDTRKGAILRSVKSVLENVLKALN